MEAIKPADDHDGHRSASNFVHAMDQAHFNRVKVVEFIQKQLNGDTQGAKLKGMDAGLWHCGVVELRELLDAVYGGPPVNPEEYLTKGN